MFDVTVRKIDETYISVKFRDANNAYDMSDFFAFDVNGAKWQKSYQRGMWDGKKRLYKPLTGKIYLGLLPYVMRFCKTNKLSVDRPTNILSVKNPIHPSKTVDWVKSLDIHAGGTKITPYGYQIKAVHSLINNRRNLVISPTSSGKSLIIYMTIRFWERILPEETKILVIVPTTSLVSQMCGDFGDYSSNVEWDAIDKCHKIYDGADKRTNKKIVVSTWQSIYQMPKSYFAKFGAVVGDEAHNFKAKCIGSIMNKLGHVPYRIGTTGTIGNESVNRLILEGMWGVQHRTITTKKMMDDGHSAKLTINAIQLMYKDYDSLDSVSNMKYQEERKWISTHTHRNKFIAKLAISQTENTLIVYETKDHGRAILAAVNEMVKDSDRKVYFFNGDVNVEERELARPEIEKIKGAIIIASLGVFSTGVNIKNIHSVIFGWIGKSPIRVLQTIGRGLRKSKTKSNVTVFDIFDNLKHQGRRNYSLSHFIDRMDIYKFERFDVTTNQINF